MVRRGEVACASRSVDSSHCAEKHGDVKSIGGKSCDTGSPLHSFAVSQLRHKRVVLKMAERHLRLDEILQVCFLDSAFDRRASCDGERKMHEKLVLDGSCRVNSV